MQTSAERTAAVAGSGSADFAALPPGTVAAPDISAVAGAGSADLEALLLDTAATPDTSFAAGSGGADLEAQLPGTAAAPDISAAAPCSGIPVPQCVPQSDLKSGLRTMLRQPLIPLLPGTNSERPSMRPQTARLPDGSHT
jgi:hypothetical protein